MEWPLEWPLWRLLDWLVLKWPLEWLFLLAQAEQAAVYYLVRCCRGTAEQCRKYRHEAVAAQLWRRQWLSSGNAVQA